MVFVIRHAGVAHVEGKGHQEELDCGSQQPCPLPTEPCLHIQLEWGEDVLACAPARCSPSPCTDVLALHLPGAPTRTAQMAALRPEANTGQPRSSRFYKQIS